MNENHCRLPISALDPIWLSGAERCGFAAGCEAGLCPAVKG